MMIAATSVVSPDAEIGVNVVIEDFCIVGQDLGSSAATDDARRTRIGRDSHLRSHTVVYANTVIGDRFRSGNKANIREFTQIGADVSVGTLAVIEHHVLIGDRVRIHSHVFVPEYTSIGSDVFIGPNAVLTNAKYPMSPNAKAELEGPTIQDGVVIGANATLLPGVEVGRMALIGAGSVVTHDVPPYAVVAGVPAQVIGDIRELPYDQ